MPGLGQDRQGWDRAVVTRHTQGRYYVGYEVVTPPSYECAMLRRPQKPSDKNATQNACFSGRLRNLRVRVDLILEFSKVE